MVSSAQKLAMKKYREKNIEMVAFEVKKGTSAEYTAAAARLGLGKMEMIRRSVEEFIQNHLGEAVTIQKSENQLSADEKKILEEVSHLPPDAQRQLVKFLQSINRTAKNNQNNQENGS